MSKENALHDLMCGLWSVMEMTLPQNDASEVYSIQFANQVEIHLLSTLPGMVDIISEAGTLQNRNSAQTLLDLIALNHHPLTVNVDHDSGTVMVWARQSIDELDIDSLIALITDLAKTVYQAKQCIDCKDARELFHSAMHTHALPGAPKGETTLAMLRRRS